MSGDNDSVPRRVEASLVMAGPRNSANVEHLAEVDLFVAVDRDKCDLRLSAVEFVRLYESPQQ